MFGSEETGLGLGEEEIQGNKTKEVRANTITRMDG